jgi:hypothetical protein
MSISTTPPEYKESEGKRNVPGSPGTKKDGPPKGPVL